MSETVAKFSGRLRGGWVSLSPGSTTQIGSLFSVFDKGHESFTLQDAGNRA